MKIGIIVPGFSSNEQDWCIPALLDFVRVLAQRAEVHVFTLRWPEHGRTYSVNGATVHACNGREHLGAKAFRLYAQTLQRIAREHQRKPFTLLHAFWADEPGWIAALTGRWLRIPVVISLAGGELIGMADIGYGVQLLPLRRTFVRWGLNSADRIGVGSDYLMQIASSQLTPANRAKLRQLPLGVDTDLFSPLKVDRSINKTPPTILNVGSLTPVKGQRGLIRALGKDPAFRLQIAGAGPLRAELMALTSDLDLNGKVRFLGEVPHESLPDVYRASAFVVQSSIYEAQGLAVLEAAACGIPVIGTPVGVLPELGIEARIEPALTSKIAGLLGDPATRRVYSESGRQKVMEKYSLEVCLRRFLALYEELIS